jgi:hypothetical protein
MAAKVLQDLIGILQSNHPAADSNGRRAKRVRVMRFIRHRYIPRVNWSYHLP